MAETKKISKSLENQSTGRLSMKSTGLAGMYKIHVTRGQKPRVGFADIFEIARPEMLSSNKIQTRPRACRETTRDTKRATREREGERVRTYKIALSRKQRAVHDRRACQHLPDIKCVLHTLAGELHSALPQLFANLEKAKMLEWRELP
jgi:hypothetical protein